jgi:hypothetical protein
MNRREEFRVKLEEILKRGDKEELEEYSIEALKMGWYIYSYYIVKRYLKLGYEYSERVDFSKGVVTAMMGFNMRKAYKRARFKDTKRYILEIIGLNDKSYPYFEEAFEPYKEEMPASYMYRYYLYRIFKGEIPDVREDFEFRTEVERYNIKMAKGIAEMMKGNLESAQKLLYENLQDTLDRGYDYTSMFIFRFLIPIVYKLQGKEPAKTLLSLAKDVANDTGNRWFFEMFEIYRWFLDGTFPEYVEDKIRFFVNRWAMIHELLARGYLHREGKDQSRRIEHIVKNHHHFHDLKVLEMFGTPLEL